jgi:ribose transport system ATP-binding protein
VDIAETTPAKLVEMMVGHTLGVTAALRARPAGRPRFRVEGASRYGFFHGICFTLHAGEILGLGGLAGAGRTELARSLCGVDPLDEGRLYLDDRPIAPADMRTAMRWGLAYLSEDRKRDGLALHLTASQNTLSALIAKTGRMIRGRNASGTFGRQAYELNVYPLEAGRQVSQFSGGNQQKILLAKWLALTPEVCILDEPTRGVDVGAKQVIHEAIGRLADQGRCVLLISSDLPELCGLADRVLIMRRGRIAREMKRGEFTADSVLLAANGER